MKKISNEEISAMADNFAIKYASDIEDQMKQRRAFRAGMLQAIKILNGNTEKRASKLFCDCLTPEPSGRYTDLKNICCKCKKRIAK